MAGLSAVLNLLAIFPTLFIQNHEFGNMLNYSLSFNMLCSISGKTHDSCSMSFDGEIHGKEYNGE
jgi:hypothetical protein